MMLPAEFVTEVLARAAEHDEDTDLTTAPVFGVVFLDPTDVPVAIDVFAGPDDLVSFAAGYRVSHSGGAFGSYRLVPFGVLAEPETKSSLIMQTALRFAGDN